MSISEALGVEHQLLPPKKEIYDDGLIISVILDCFYGLDYIKQAVQSVIDQEYNNVELMLINNGASEEIETYLLEAHSKYKNTSLITFKENQFSWSDRERPVYICWNVALNYCIGEAVTHLAYDDMLSKNYAAKMAKLFNENPNCTTASPLPVSINSEGERNLDKDFLKGNNRPRYIQGKEVALDFVRGSPKKMFGAPGEILAIRKSILLKYSGFDGWIDVSQILKFAINGEIGFDPEAHVYWRHHALQSNRQASDKGHIDVRANKRAIKRSDIFNIWKNEFSLEEVELLKIFINNRLKKIPNTSVGYMVVRKNLFGLFLVFFHIFRECPQYLGGAILHSITLTFKIVLNKFRKVKGL